MSMVRDTGRKTAVSHHVICLHTSGFETPIVIIALNNAKPIDPKVALARISGHNYGISNSSRQIIGTDAPEQLCLILSYKLDFILVLHTQQYLRMK